MTFHSGNCGHTCYGFIGGENLIATVRFLVCNLAMADFFMGLYLGESGCRSIAVETSWLSKIGQNHCLHKDQTYDWLPNNGWITKSCKSFFLQHCFWNWVVAALFSQFGAFREASTYSVSSGLTRPNILIANSTQRKLGLLQTQL